MDEFVQMEDEYSDEIDFFIKTFKMFISCGMHDLIASMIGAKLSAQFHSDSKLFEELLSATKDQMESINDFHKTFMQRKVKIRNKITELLNKRDEMIKLLKMARNNGETLEEAS